MPRGVLLLAGLVSMVLPLASCRSPATAARQQLARDLAQKRDASPKAMKLYQRGQTAQREGARDQAMKFYAEAVKTDPDNIFAALALGEIEFQREHYYAAAEQFHRAARLAPTRFEPRFNLGSVLEAAGRYSEAIAEYEAALRLAPEQVEVMENLARTLVICGDNAERVRQLSERALKNEERPEWRRWLLVQTLRRPSTAPAGDVNANAERLRGTSTGESR